jgi:hypothetical protein
VNDLDLIRSLVTDLLEAFREAATSLDAWSKAMPGHVSKAVSSMLRTGADALDAEAAALRAEQLEQHNVVGIEAEAALLVVRMLAGAMRRCVS